MISRQASHQTFFAVSALLFVASAALTALWCRSMSGMGNMPMPGGWTMSMTWMRMPGQSWAAAASSFLIMWIVMMLAMMLPSLIPALWRYREAANLTGEAHLGRRTSLVGMGYFLVWAAFGIAIFPLGVTLASLEMRHPALARAVPIAVGVIVLLAGALQFTAWKAHHLAYCRSERGPSPARPALRHGLRLGLHCIYGCAPMTAILLAVGIMDLRAMALVTAAITAERLAPAGLHVARSIGVVILATGLLMIARAGNLA